MLHSRQLTNISYQFISSHRSRCFKKREECGEALCFANQSFFFDWLRLLAPKVRMPCDRGWSCPKPFTTPLPREFHVTRDVTLSIFGDDWFEGRFPGWTPFPTPKLTAKAPENGWLEY